VKWGSFRPEYESLGKLCYRLPKRVHFHLVTATCPPSMLRQLKEKLHMDEDNTVVVRRSNDRPNIHLVIEEMQHPINSWHDLNQILQLHVCTTSEDNNRPPPFLVFVNKRKEAEEGCAHEWQSLPDHLKAKIVWFHSGMSRKFQEDVIQALKDGNIWGLFCTDAAGMVKVCYS
jgi:superfamily II DNA helicase RecQ